MVRSGLGQRPVVPDASLVAKWYVPFEPGTEHALTFLSAYQAGALSLATPDQLKVEVVRTLQLAVRNKRYSVSDGLRRVELFLNLPLDYVPNDTLFGDAFRLASQYQMALYDALYLALAQQLDTQFVTADRRFYNLAQQRGISGVAWFEVVAPNG